MHNGRNSRQNQEYVWALMDALLLELMMNNTETSIYSFRPRKETPVIQSIVP